MNRYRSLETLQAIQYLGEPIPDVTCHGTPEQVQTNGCDPSRKQHPHVHTQATGGMTVLKVGDWIFPMAGGPWGVASDARFRGSWEVPAAAPLVVAAQAEAPAIVATESDSGLAAMPDNLVVMEPPAPLVDEISADAAHSAPVAPEPVSHVGESGE